MRIARTFQEHAALIDDNLNSTKIRSVDIATFRIGSNEHLPAFLATVASKYPTRLLLGLGVKLAFQEDNKPGSDIDICVGIAEEAIIKEPKLQCCYLHESHLKLWVFRRRSWRLSTAIITGRNLNYSNWVDLSIEVEGDDVYQLWCHFNEAWAKGTPIKPSAFTLSLQRKPF